MLVFFFFFNDTATTEIYTLSLHDALPISITTQEIPGMSPRAIASRASFASDAAGASQTTRSAGAPTVMVPVPRARRKIRALFPVASASASAGGRSPSEASSHTLLTTPMGMTPVPVGVSLATHRRASAPASRQRRKRESAERRLPACTDRKSVV